MATPTAADTPADAPRKPAVWMVRAEGGKYTDQWVRGGYASIGFCMDAPEAPDLETPEQFEDAYRRHNPSETSDDRIRTNARQVYRFVVEIRPGDYIVTPEVTSDTLRYGVVADEPVYYDAVSEDEEEHHIRRRIDWNSDGLQRSILSVPFQRSLTGWLTVFSLRKHAHAFFTKIGKPELAPTTAQPPGTMTDPYEVALAQLMEFEPHEFEEFCGALLSAMGFEQVRVTKKSGDGGVDVMGVLHASTLAQVRLFVQVKRYQPQNRINKAAVEDVRRGIPFGGQGAFITTSDFAKGAVEAASAPEFPHIGLVNGSQLVDLLLEHWDDIPDEFRNRLNLKPGLVPA